MPLDIMNNIHEVGMPGSYHLLFWLVVVAVAVLLLFSIWWFGIRGKRSRLK